MKKLLILWMAGLLVACGEPALTPGQQFELTKLQMIHNHERDLARIQANTQREIGYVEPQQGTTYEPQYAQPAESYNVDGAAYGNQSYESGSSDSGIGGTLMAVAGGALAGYAVSELLDDGFRTYTDKSGKSVYVDKNGRQIDKRDYDAYKEKHPTKHKLSTYNQAGKQAVNTGATKTVNAASTVKTKTVEAAKKVDQKVVQPTKKAVQKKTSSSKRR